MFYRPGGTAKAPNRQYDTVYVDFKEGATDWLPVNEGDTIAVNLSRASLAFGSPAQSTITTSPVSAEVQVLLEQKLYGSDPNVSARPIDQWQNLVVATSRRSHRAGWVRMRVVSINNSDGTGVVMDLQISRTGNSGVAG
jgi:hypothetical protein